MPFNSTINVLVRDHVPKVSADNYLMRLHRYTGEEAYVEGSFEELNLTWDFTEEDIIPEELLEENEEDNPKPGCLSPFTASSSLYIPAPGWEVNQYHMSIKDLMDKEAWYVSADGMSWEGESRKADYMASIADLLDTEDANGDPIPSELRLSNLAKYNSIDGLPISPSGTSNSAWKFWLLATGKLSYYQIMTYTFVYHDDIKAVVLYMHTEDNTVHEDFGITMCNCKQYPDCKDEDEEEWPEPDPESTGFYNPPPVAIAARGAITLERAKARKEQAQSCIYSYIINKDDYIDDPDGLRNAIGNARAGWGIETQSIVIPAGEPIIAQGGMVLPASGWGYATRKLVRRNEYNADDGLQYTSKVYMNGTDITENISSKKSRTFYKPLGKNNEAWQNYLNSVKKRDNSCVTCGDSVTLYKLETAAADIVIPDCPSDEPDCVGTCYTSNTLSWSGVRTVYIHEGLYMNNNIDYDIFQGFRLHNTDMTRWNEMARSAYSLVTKELVTTVDPRFRKLLEPPTNIEKFSGRTETTLVTVNDSMASSISVEKVYNYTKKNYSYFPFGLFNCTKNQHTSLVRDEKGRVTTTSYATAQEIPHDCIKLAPTYSSRSTTTEIKKVYKDVPLSELSSISSSFTIWFHYYTLKHCNIMGDYEHQLDSVTTSFQLGTGAIGVCGHWNDASTEWVPYEGNVRSTISYRGYIDVDGYVAISRGTKSGPFTDCWDMTNSGNSPTTHECPWGCNGEEDTLTLQASGTFGKVVLKTTNHI